MSCIHPEANRVAVLICWVVDIMAFIKDTPPPATVILISSDRDFTYLLSTVRWRKYNVVLISNSSMTNENLTAQASVAYDWKSDILDARPPSKPPLFRSQTLSPVASLTTPQESERLPEYQTHPVGLANKSVAPATHPVTPSPPPDSTVTASKLCPRCATLPPDAPPMKSEATHMPAMAGTPAEVAPASIPMSPTSDDKTVADLVGGSTMVHLETVHGIPANLVFQQDPATPKIVDPVEGGIYSLAFVSACTGMYPYLVTNPRVLESFGTSGSQHLQSQGHGSIMCRRP